MDAADNADFYSDETYYETDLNSMRLLLCITITLKPYPGQRVSVVDIHTYTKWRLESSVDLKMHDCGLCAETRVPGENVCCHRENMQIHTETLK